MAAINSIPSSAGLIGNAAVVLETNSAAMATDGSRFNFPGSGNEFTVAVWVYPTSFGATRVAVAKWSEGARNWSLRLQNNGVFFVIANSAGTVVTPQAGTNASLNAWALLFGWYDARSGVCCQVNTGTVGVSSCAPDHRTTTTVSLTVGAAYLSGTTPPDLQPFMGRIDAIGIWSRRLTPEERRDLYNSGNGRQWPFE